jgi:hypothetical protein
MLLDQSPILISTALGFRVYETPDGLLVDSKGYMLSLHETAMIRALLALQPQSDERKAA